MPFSKSILFSRLVSLLTRNISARWIRLVCLVVFFAVVLSILPVRPDHNGATAQGSRQRRTQGVPSRNLTNLDEARGIEPGTPKLMPPVPATKCRGRDEKCKKAKEKISSNLSDNQDRLPAHAGHQSGRSYVDWFGAGISALSALPDLIYWPARMISNFPDIPYRYDGVALAESAVKGANPRSKTLGNVASGGPRKDYGYRGSRSRPPVAAQSSEVVWVDDALPAGAAAGGGGGDGWNWVSSSPEPKSGSVSHISNIADWSNWSPPPYSGNVSHQSSISSGFHQHQYFSSPTLIPVRYGGTLYAYIYMDPENPPQQVMLQWGTNTDGWEHRAYWGANLIGLGTDGTASRRYRGPLPAAGGWVRLEVPASAVGLEGLSVNAMAFTLHGGRANWDLAGISGVNVWDEWKCVWNGWDYDCYWQHYEDYENFVLVDDSFPAGAASGADGGDSWNWRGANNVDLLHQHYFYNASDTLQLNAGDKLFTWVYLDPAYFPQQVMLQWHENGSWDHRAYWGANKIGWGADGTASRRYMGALPPAGQWVRLEVEASAVGLEGKTLNGMAFTLYGGRASWDKAGKKMGNDAAFVSQSVPATMTAGEAYPVTITMLNQGTTTWTPGQAYRLGSQNPQDNTTWLTTNRVGLPGASVSPGATTTFSFVATAPSSPGSYNFQWQMVQDGVEWFGAKTTNMAVQVVPRVDQAQFVSQSVPSVMTRQNAYSVSVTMKNTGNTTWDSNYRLGSQNPQDNTTWGPHRVFLASGETIPPGGSKTFTFTVTAPASPSSYALFQWRMVHEAVQWFGDYSSGVVVALSPGNLNMALIDPINRIGGSPGEDLLSRNYNWSLPLLSLPGRAGLDLGLALSLNSLIYTRAGSVMYFDAVQGDPAPGFTLGFPQIRNAFINTEAGAQSYLLTMPSGRRVEFRQISTNGYEAVDSSYMLLTHDPVNSTFTLYTTDGTRCRFVDVTGSGDYKCVQIKDRHGNYITIDYGSLAKISTVTDTVGRVVNFNYDGSNHLISITQNWGGQTHTWATFAYGTQTIQTNFTGMTLNGTANGTPESVLLRVELADGSIYSFEYNTYAQVKTIRRYAPNHSGPANFPGDYTQLAYTTYGLPDNANDPQTDCPRITSRTDWANDWTQATSTYLPDSSFSTGQVTFPDGTRYKEFFATTGWQRGLTMETENWSGEVRKKWTTLQWTQDNTGVVYRLNPRVTETNVYDDANNRRRTTMSYTSFGLVSDVYEYDANATTVLRRAHTDYNLSSIYTDRRIIGLPSEQFLYDGANNLFSKATYEYDLNPNPNPNPYLQHPGPTVQHDTANYGSGFVQGRGNLNRRLRWDITAETNESKASEYETGYNTSGSAVFTRDPLEHKTSVSYDDSFSDGLNNRNTYAYPTKITDPDTFPSSVQYNFDHGAVTWTQNPKEAAVTQTYDAAGRIERRTNMVNGAYTRYVYALNQLNVKSFTTVNDLSSEFYQITVFDGHNRVRGVASEHPGSAGGYKAQIYEYNNMGRLARQTNPTEITNPTEFDVNWTTAGDDAAAGLRWTSQDYDWNGRRTITTHPDGTTNTISYNGCGCAGAQTMAITDENGYRENTYDVLGRITRTFGAGLVITNTYNVRDQLETSTSRPHWSESGPFQVTTSTYDGYGRLQSQKLPIQSFATTYTYNADDTVLTKTDPRGITATYSYNNRKLVTGIDYAEISGIPSADVNFGYDQLGKRLWMTDVSGQTNYQFDSLGWLRTETKQFAGLPGNYQITYDYNLSGEVQSISTSTGAAVNYQYDKVGNLTSVAPGAGFAGVSQFISSQSYRAWGGVKTIGYGNGRNLSYGYNERLRIANYNLQGVSGASYEYYQTGLLKKVTDQSLVAYNYKFNYDLGGRVIHAFTGSLANDQQPLETSDYGPYRMYYGYDSWGNLVTRYYAYWQGELQIPGVPSPVYVNNRNSQWQYDAAGQVLNASGHQYTYDSEGRTLKMVNNNVPGPPVPSPTNIYDGDDLQVKSIAPNGTPLAYYLRSTILGGRVLVELNSAGQSKSTFVYANGVVLARQNNTTGNVSWIFRDPANLGERILSASGALQEIQMYDPLGNPTDPVNTNFPGGNPYDTPFIPGDDPIESDRCKLDGTPINCKLAVSFIAIGAAKLDLASNIFETRPGQPTKPINGPGKESGVASGSIILGEDPATGNTVIIDKDPVGKTAVDQSANTLGPVGIGLGFQNQYIQKLRTALGNLPSNCKEALGGEENYMALLNRLGEDYKIMAYNDPKPPVNKNGNNLGETYLRTKNITTVLGKRYFEPTDDEKYNYRFFNPATVNPEFNMDAFQDFVLVHEFTHVIYKNNFNIDQPARASHEPIWKDLIKRGFDVPDAYIFAKMQNPDFKPSIDQTANMSVNQFFLKGCPKVKK
jgi:YD repeat-containing protein